MATADGLLKLSIAVNTAGCSFQRVTVALNKLRNAMILISAHYEAGNWPDYFSLINRYLRTDLIPTAISDKRWEA